MQKSPLRYAQLNTLEIMPYKDKHGTHPHLPRGPKRKRLPLKFKKMAERFIADALDTALSSLELNTTDDHLTSKAWRLCLKAHNPGRIPQAPISYIRAEIDGKRRKKTYFPSLSPTQREIKITQRKLRRETASKINRAQRILSLADSIGFFTNRREIYL